MKIININIQPADNGWFAIADLQRDAIPANGALAAVPAQRQQKKFVASSYKELLAVLDDFMGKTQAAEAAA